MKNLKNLPVILGLVIALGLACGGGNPVPSEFQGNWVGTDGSTIYMNGDGKAGFKLGGKTVDGGGAEIDKAANTLTISLFGISETWTIDEPPMDGEMTLSGVVYRRR